MSDINFFPKQSEKETLWTLDVDYVNTWVKVPNLLTPEECNELIKIGNSKTLSKASTVGENEIESDQIRKSDVAWIYSSDNSKIYRKLVDSISFVNTQYYKFDLFGLTEGFQFTRYCFPGGKYGKHVDCIYNGVIRKLSIAIQLNDPSEYDGGDFNFHFSDKHDVADKGLGMGVFFPSYMMHEVTPVTRGTRYSLVAWVTGKPFK